MLTHERNKSRRTNRGCLLCFNMGAASTTFAYIEVEFIEMYKKDASGEKLKVEKQIGLCWKHCQCKTERNPGGLLDPEVGIWNKSSFGKVPIKEELYQLVGGKTNYKLVTGPSGKIPSWW